MQLTGVNYAMECLLGCIPPRPGFGRGMSALVCTLHRIKATQEDLQLLLASPR